MLDSMSNSSDVFDPTEVFADPVAYLAQFEIEVELITNPDDSLSLAA